MRLRRTSCVTRAENERQDSDSDEMVQDDAVVPVIDKSAADPSAGDDVDDSIDEDSDSDYVVNRGDDDDDEVEAADDDDEDADDSDDAEEAEGADGEGDATPVVRLVAGGSDGGNRNDLDHGGGHDDVDEEEEGEDHEEEGAGDYMDDGTEENDSTASGGNVRRPLSIQEFLAWRLLGRVPRGSEVTRSRYAPYEEAIPQALTRGSLWQQLNLATAAAGPPVRNRAARFDEALDAGVDCSLLASRSAPYGLKVRQAVCEAVSRDPRVAARVLLRGGIQRTDAAVTPGGGSPDSPSAASTASAATALGAAAASAASAPSTTASLTSPRTRKLQQQQQQPPCPRGPTPPATPLPPPGYLSGLACVPSLRLLMRREQGEATGPGAGWSGAQMRHMTCYRALPRYPRALVDRLDSRAYIGQFSADGQFFVAAFQDRRVRLYDVDRGWRLRKDITTRMCRWTITDTSISPDQRFVIYSSIIPVVHLVEVGSVYDSVSSICNITQVHEALNFDTNNGGFGIWSVKWSGDGREIVVGNNDSSVVVMDVETKRVVAAVNGHDDDVNAVTYADASPNIIVSGSDDTYIKVWDRRTMPGPEPPESPAEAVCRFRGQPRPVGVLVGHTEGLTHLNARGDGLHVLSNAKDQTAKLWDLRMLQAGGSLRDAPSAARLSGAHVPQFNWDYRWQEYPAAGRVVRHPYDSSIQTFRGHTVQNTLIRAYFSPAHSTGQRFVYTGSAEGGVHVYDVASGQEVEGSPLRLHRKLVRDVSWHPYDPVLATVSWDGTVVRWDAVPPTAGSRALQVPGHDALNDDY